MHADREREGVKKEEKDGGREEERGEGREKVRKGERTRYVFSPSGCKGQN